MPAPALFTDAGGYLYADPECQKPRAHAPADCDDGGGLLRFVHPRLKDCREAGCTPAPCALVVCSACGEEL